jgi:hypothetical protein
MPARAVAPEKSVGPWNTLTGNTISERSIRNVALSSNTAPVNRESLRTGFRKFTHPLKIALRKYASSPKVALKKFTQLSKVALKKFASSPKIAFKKFAQS